MEIGSIYEIDPADVKETGDRSSAAAFRLAGAERYGKKYISYTASGREAIFLALKSIEKNSPGISKRCLMPAYMCDTVFFPFEQAGWELSFYHIGKNMEASEAELHEKLKNIRPGLLFIHCYYGIDTWKSMRPLFRDWKKEGMFVMEDVTQSYYLEGAGCEADYIIGSLRKWYPVPDGGFAASDFLFSGEKMQSNMEFSKQKLELLTDKWNYLYGQDAGKKELKDSYLKRNRETEERLDEVKGANSISEASCCLLEKEEEEAARVRRKENCRILFDSLQGLRHFSYIRDHIEEDAAPLYFPIYVKERDSVQEYLRLHDIYAPVLWAVGKENKDFLTAQEKYIYEHLLALPMDQRYGRKEMSKIAEVMREYNDRYTG